MSWRKQGWEAVSSNADVELVEDQSGRTVDAVVLPSTPSKDVRIYYTLRDPTLAHQITFTLDQRQHIRVGCNCLRIDVDLGTRPDLEEAWKHYDQHLEEL